MHLTISVILVEVSLLVGLVEVSMLKVTWGLIFMDVIMYFLE